MLETVHSQLQEIAKPLEAGFSQVQLDKVFGRKLGSLLSKTEADVAVDLLLRSDVLRVTFICLYADGKLSADETEVVAPFVSKLARLLAKLRPDVYSIFRAITAESVDKFYRVYWQDNGPFGFMCQETKWSGLLLCRAVDNVRAVDGNTRNFADCLLELSNELAQIDGIDERSRRAFEKLTSDLYKHRDTDHPQKTDGENVSNAKVDRTGAAFDETDGPRSSEAAQQVEDGQPVKAVETETSTWTVVLGGKRRTGLTRGSLQNAADRGKLRKATFLRAEDDTTDWFQAGVCEWLFDPPDESCTRYCGECLSRLTGTESTFSECPPCPGCNRSTEYIDFLRQNPPPLSDVPIEPWGIYDSIVVAMGIVFVFTALCCVLSLLFTSSSLPALLGFIFLVASSGLFFYSYQHRSETSKYRKHLEKVESSLTERTSDLHRIQRGYTLLQNNLQRVRDDLIAETTDRCAKMESEADSALEAALHNEATVERVAQRYLDEQRKWWTQKLKGDNYQLQKSRIEKAISFVEKEAFVVPQEMKREIFDQLKHDYEMRVRKELEMERQRAAKAKLKAEQKAARDAEEARIRAEAEQRAIQQALDEALAKTGAEHSAEVEELQRQLREAEERGQRAVSQAQLTKVGYVYVISNIGCFGENVFKVGLTRRLEPLDRVKELSGASVAFPFDVHMLIFSEDAPALEHTLHKALHKYRVNRVNFRKEFFRVDMAKIHELVMQHHGEVEYLADAEALEYQNSLEISDEDFEFLESVAEQQGLDFESDEE